LETCKLSPNDREQIARRLGFRIHADKLDRALLAKRAGLEPKELHRLVLGHGEETYDKYRLRAAGKKYAAVIRSLAELVRTNAADLADRMTRGTEVHPSPAAASSRSAKVLKFLYDLADGIDAQFQLTKKFAVIAQAKREDDAQNPWALWPARLSEEEWQSRANNPEFSEGPPREERLHQSFWNARTAEEKAAQVRRLEERARLEGHFFTLEPTEEIERDSSFGFENSHWDQVIGYLPHFFLGHERDFAWDADFWPAPTDLPDDSTDEQRMSYFADALFVVTGSNPWVATDWDEATGKLLFNKEPADAYRRRMYQFQQRNGVQFAPEVWGEESDEPTAFDPPAFFWLCLYPNADATGLIPVLISTNWWHGDDNTVELIDERVLANMESFDVLGGETLGQRLRDALLGPGRILKSEWVRTARFVERHPLWLRHEEYQATERDIDEWLKGILKGKLPGMKAKGDGQ
jgi:hypothetical protein